MAGIHNIPPRSASSLTHRPLIVGLHGGTYDCHYFDADNAHTALLGSSAYGVPFVSIDRPGYGGSSFLPVPENSSFPEETGIWLHRYILPALWAKFGDNGCNCIVLLCHSLGSMGGIVAAALHAQDPQSAYPLGGLIVSGLADRLLPSMKENPVRAPNVSPEHVLFPLRRQGQPHVPAGDCSSGSPKANGTTQLPESPRGDREPAEDMASYLARRMGLSC